MMENDDKPQVQLPDEFFKRLAEVNQPKEKDLTSQKVNIEGIYRGTCHFATDAHMYMDDHIVRITFMEQPFTKHISFTRAAVVMTIPDFAKFMDLAGRTIMAHNKKQKDKSDNDDAEAPTVANKEGFELVKGDKQ